MTNKINSNRDLRWPYHKPLAPAPKPLVHKANEHPATRALREHYNQFIARP